MMTVAERNNRTMNLQRELNRLNAKYAEYMRNLENATSNADCAYYDRRLDDIITRRNEVLNQMRGY